MMAHPYYQPKVIGKITLPDTPIKHKCVCEDCNSEVDDRFGDPRVMISTYATKTDIKPISVRWICESCADELFGDSEPSSIFG